MLWQVTVVDCLILSGRRRRLDWNERTEFSENHFAIRINCVEKRGEDEEPEEFRKVAALVGVINFDLKRVGEIRFGGHL